MASRRPEIVQQWQRDQARDLRDLPHAARLVRPGPFGTFAERTDGSAPEAPTLDSGPLYTGEWREEVDGDPLVVDTDEPTILCSLRRPWPFVGFAIDTSKGRAGQTLTAGLLLITRSGHTKLLNNVLGGAAVAPQIAVVGVQVPWPWVGMTGIFVGMRVALFVTNTGGEAPTSLTVKGNLWGYNSPGFGP